MGEFFHMEVNGCAGCYRRQDVRCAVRRGNSLQVLIESIGWVSTDTYDLISFCEVVLDDEGLVGYIEAADSE